MRQSAASRTYKVGMTAPMFQVLDFVTLYGYVANPTDGYITETGIPGVDYVYHQGGLLFAANVDAPVSIGSLSPQSIVLPSKSTVNAKISVIWDDTTGVGEKVGWLVYCQHTLIGDPLMGVAPDGFKQSSTDPAQVDYTFSTLPAYDSLWAFPRTQFAIGYGTADQMLKATPVYHLEYDTSSTLKLDDTYALKGMREYIDDTYVLLTFYVYRTAGMTAGGSMDTFLQDGHYDADGCGSLDSDNFAGSARFLGLLLEFD